MSNNETAVLIDETAVLIDELLSVFVPVFVEKELDASSKQRYNPSNSEEKGEKK